MSTQEKLVELAEESVRIIKEVINRVEEKTQIVNVNCNKCGDTIIFKLKNDKTIEYSLSELGYIFKDDLEGLEVFSVKEFKEFYLKLQEIQLKTELL
ncbi:hypothetical protein [Clostridium sp. D53t1_180928_C8]|uniref:hypothetical protein n=1 Tax=Clostridium sp. D53t1_180928_C8 TaxID=2787101 RepID=UPI0018AAD13B|nr:hypothetical protein [Clostridium sp. D53t1_180928_C8]